MVRDKKYLNKEKFMNSQRNIHIRSIYIRAMSRDIRAKKSIGEIEAHSDPISAVDFNASGSSFATSSYDGLIRIWESAYLKCLKEAYAPGAPPV